MFAKNRQDQIDERVRQFGAVTTAALVEDFQVSVETIRRDLLALEEQGRLIRVHGGAVIPSDMKPYFALEKRSLEFSEQKKKLSRRAAGCVEDGDVIGIDAGSTAICFAQALKERFARLTIVTHSLDVFNLLKGHREFSVIVCGGHFLQSENAFCGGLALEMLQTLHVQKAFVCPSAVSIEWGICDYQADLYPMQKQLLHCADHIYILADSSKFEKKALLKLADMKREYHYVTDNGLNEGLKRVYEENQMSILIG